MTELVFFLEEPSAREMLKGLLDRLLPPSISCRYVVFQGKQDLHKRLGLRLRGWLDNDTHFIVLRDKDSGDCVQTKRELRVICDQAGKPGVLIRIACHELESWYLGDLRAVEQGLEISGVAKMQGNGKFRAPDRLANAQQELSRISGQRYQKLAGSRAIGPHLSLTENRSHSFGVFINGVTQLVHGAQ